MYWYEYILIMFDIFSPGEVWNSHLILSILTWEICFINNSRKGWKTFILTLKMSETKIFRDEICATITYNINEKFYLFFYLFTEISFVTLKRISIHKFRSEFLLFFIQNNLNFQPLFFFKEIKFHFTNLLYE